MPLRLYRDSSEDLVLKWQFWVGLLLGCLSQDASTSGSLISVRHLQSKIHSPDILCR